MMKVRIKSHGEHFWQFEVSDIETGRRLPVLLDDKTWLSIGDAGGLLVARVTLIVHEIDVNASAQIAERVEYVTPEVGESINGLPGVIVRQPGSKGLRDDLEQSGIG